MEGVEQVEQISGNIQCSEISGFTSEDNGFQAIKYFLTYHTDKFIESFEQIKMNLIPLCKKYIFAEEHGKSGKTPHIQGAFILHSKMRANTINKDCFVKGASLFKLKNWDRAFKYCIKEGNNIISSERIPKPLEVIKDLRKYQQDIIDIVKTDPKAREIYWFWGGKNIGKTEILFKLCAEHNAYILPITKRHALSQVFKSHEEVDTYCFNLTADESEYQTHDMFSILECIKDRMFPAAFGTECNGMCLMNHKHLIIMANEPPDITKTIIDYDRFNLFKIEENFETTEYFYKKVDNYWNLKPIL